MSPDKRKKASAPTTSPNHTPKKAPKKPKPAGSSVEKTAQPKPSERSSSKAKSKKTPSKPVQTDTPRKPRRAVLFHTTHLTSEEARNQRKWVHIDASGAVLGRLCAHVASILRGKTKPEYSRHLDAGDFVVITNAAKISLTGKKWKDKRIYHHTGYMGHLYSKPAQDIHARHPDRLIRLAVKNMLPKNNLSRQILKKLKVYAGAEHPHVAQSPRTLETQK